MRRVSILITVNSRLDRGEAARALVLDEPFRGQINANTPPVRPLDRSHHRKSALIRPSKRPSFVAIQAPLKSTNKATDTREKIYELKGSFYSILSCVLF